MRSTVECTVTVFGREPPSLCQNQPGSLYIQTIPTQTCVRIHLWELVGVEKFKSIQSKHGEARR